MNRRHKILGLLGLIVLLALWLNPGYLWKQIQYKISGPQGSAPAQAELAEKNHLWIPSLHIEAPVTYPGEENEKSFQEALRSGVAHYPGTALPGQSGNVYIFGHSSDYLISKGNYKTVFALLPQIEKGAEILLTDPDGKVYHYRVIDKFVAAKDDLSVLDQKNYEKKLLTLQTSYPIGTALRRYIVVAEMEK